MAPKTNLELVTEFMDYKSALHQVFVMDAIGKLADMVIESQDELRESMKGHFVNPEAWIKCAKDWKEMYEQNHGK